MPIKPSGIDCATSSLPTRVRLYCGGVDRVVGPAFTPASLLVTSRASFLLNELREEQRNGERCELPDMKIGDAIEVTVSFLPTTKGSERHLVSSPAGLTHQSERKYAS